MGDRTRLDLMHYKGRLGIRGPFLPQGSFDFFDVPKPDSAHPSINEMLELFLESKFPIEVAQIRFRLGPSGIQGIWIDAGNEQIKALKDQPTWVEKMLLRGWVIEAGQKRKEFKLAPEGHLSFEEATPRAWLDSHSKNGDSLALLSQIALFSQPGPEINRALIAAGFEVLDCAQIEQASWIEWGAGYGNLTAAFASYLGTDNCESSELDEGAAACLKLNAEKFFAGVRINRKAAEAELEDQPFELWIMDPPRSGFPQLLEKIPRLKNRPNYILSYHCHEKGLTADIEQLKKANFELYTWVGIDAFPATPHQEVVSLWKSR